MQSGGFLVRVLGSFNASTAKIRHCQKGDVHRPRRRKAIYARFARRETEPYKTMKRGRRTDPSSRMLVPSAKAFPKVFLGGDWGGLFSKKSSPIKNTPKFFWEGVGEGFLGKSPPRKKLSQKQITRARKSTYRSCKSGNRPR